MQKKKSAPSVLGHFQDHFYDSGAISGAGIGRMLRVLAGAVGPPHTRRAPGPPSTATPDRSHVKLGDSRLVNNLERGEAAEGSSQTAGRRKEPNRREGRINLDRLGRGNLDPPLWENVQTCSLAASVCVLLSNQPTDFPTGFFITGS